MLDAAHDAVKEADPGAKVVLAGLTGTEDGSPWDILRYQYRRGGILGSFDVAAMHLYTGKPENVVEGVRLFRRVMKRHGDGGKPVWLTEFGITASKGRTKAPRSQRTLRTTDRGMASFLHEAYRRLAGGTGSSTSSGRTGTRGRRPTRRARASSGSRACTGTSTAASSRNPRSRKYRSSARRDQA